MKQSVVVYNTQQRPLITGWREHNGKNLWHILLRPSPTNMPTLPTYNTISSLQVFSDYDLPSVDSLAQYFHEAAGFPVRDTWLRAFKFGNYSCWPELTYANAAKLCPSSDTNIIGNLVQSIQGVRSTKTKLVHSCHTPQLVGSPSKSYQELHIHTKHIRKLYTTTLGNSQFVPAVKINTSLFHITVILMSSLSPPSIQIRIHIDSLRATIS